MVSGNFHCDSKRQKLAELGGVDCGSTYDHIYVFPSAPLGQVTYRHCNACLRIWTIRLAAEFPAALFFSQLAACMLLQHYVRKHAGAALSALAV